MNFFQFNVVIMVVSIVLAPDPLAAAGPFEQPPVFKASEILPPSLLSGPHHRVMERVVNDGYINRYSIATRFGTFSGVTTANLRKRIREVNALSLMEKVRGTKVFRESMQEAGGDVLRGLKTFVTSPFKTVKTSISGVGKVFSRVRENLFGSKRSDAEDKRWKAFIGFSKSKREYAYSFNVDVYSTNKVLQEELDDFAWLGYSGGLTVTGAMTAVPGAAGIVTAVTGSTRFMNEVYATTAPVDLRIMNREKLVAMGINEDLVDVFIDNTVFTPRQQTDLVFALEDLKGVRNRSLFVKFAIGTSHPDVAFFRQRMAQMYAVFHNKVAPIDRFLSIKRNAPIKNIGMAQTVDGVIAFHAPLDYLSWTEEMATIFDAINRYANTVPNKGKQLWLAGNLSPMARSNIEAAGWQIFHDQEINLLGKIEGATERVSYR